MKLRTRIHVLSVATIAAALGFSPGCTTSGVKPAGQPGTATEDPAVTIQTRFEQVIQRLLNVEPKLSDWLDHIQTAMDKPAQAAIERDLLRYLSGEAFAQALGQDKPRTVELLLREFSAGNATALQAARLDRPLFEVIDELARIAPEIAELAALSEEGRSLERIFLLVRRDVLPAIVETRAILTEEQLESTEAAALAQRVEEQLQSINAQLTSLQSRARSLSAPTLPPP